MISNTSTGRIHVVGNDQRSQYDGNSFWVAVISLLDDVGNDQRSQYDGNNIAIEPITLESKSGTTREVSTMGTVDVPGYTSSV